MLRILVTGNQGYIGPVVSKIIKEEIPNVFLIGLDTGFFYSCNTCFGRHGDNYYDLQINKDVRDISADDIKDIDSIIHLAAISNDPMGKEFESITREVNQEATVHLAKLASENGVKSFTFASSCSMYGAGGHKAKVESDATNPLTAYAKSKIGVEKNLVESLSSSEMKITNLRFSTACGASDRLRLDLVLNDFVASALKFNHIDILSDGSPWRPLIDVKDMGRAIVWSIIRDEATVNPLSINVGANEWNYQIKDLALAVGSIIEKASININNDAMPDKRSYCVDFSLFKKLAGEFYPRNTLDQSIKELIDVLRKVDLPKEGFREIGLFRLNHIKNLKNDGYLSDNLRWV